MIFGDHAGGAVWLKARSSLFGEFRAWAPRTRSWILVSLITLGSLVGCEYQDRSSGSALSFESLCGLAPEQFAQMDESEIRQWLTKNYGAGSTDRPQSSAGRKDEIVIDVQGTSAFLRGGHLYEILHPLSTGLTFGQVVARIGPPGTIYRYKTMYENLLYTLGLDYYQQGVSFYASGLTSMQEANHNGNLAIQLQEGTQVDLIECYMPSPSIEDALRQIYPSAPDTLEFQLKSRKPWPGFGSWVSLE